MVAGLYIQQSNDGLGADSTYLNNHLDVQLHSKFTINSSSTAGSFTAPFFEANESSGGSWYPFNGVNKFTLPNTTTAWNKPNNPVHVTKFTLQYIVGSLWFRPQVGKTVCIIDVNKNYVNNTTTITMLSSPTTSVEFFDTGPISQVGGNFIEMYKYDPFTAQNEIIFNEEGLKKSYKVREIQYMFVNHVTGQSWSNTIVNGMSYTFNYNPSNSPYTSGFLDVEYPKIFINTSSVYNYYNNNTDMRGVCIKYNADKTISCKYWNRLSGINVTFLTDHVPPITTGITALDPDTRYDGDNHPINKFQMPVFAAYFPNVF